MANRSGSVTGGVGVGDGDGVGVGEGVGEGVGVADSDGAVMVVVVLLLSGGVEQAVTNSMAVNKRQMARTRGLPQRLKTGRQRRWAGWEGFMTLTSGGEKMMFIIA
mgnify:CR=1 FL=1|jgi:hypothetical protein